jgi:hypothetical protein
MSPEQPEYARHEALSGIRKIGKQGIRNVLGSKAVLYIRVVLEVQVGDPNSLQAKTPLPQAGLGPV